MDAQRVSVGARIRILRSRNPDRIGKLATIIGDRRPGRSVVTGLPNYVHPIELDGGLRSVNGKPIAVEDGTFEIIIGEAEAAADDMSAAYALKLMATGDADGPIGADGIARLDNEAGAA